MLNLLLPFFSGVPPVAVVVPATLSLNPASPGDLGLAPATWTTKVTVGGGAGLTQVKWMVGVNGAKTINFARTANGVSVAGYNHGDVINFTGYGTGFTLTKSTSGANAFFASGSLGSTTFNIGAETQTSDVRFTIEGADGTGPLAYTVVNLTAGQVDIQATFYRPGDSLIVKSLDETVSAISGGVVFGGAGTKSITLTPSDPGNLITAPAAWTTRVNAVGLSQVQWIVLDANWVGSGTTEFTVIDLVNNTAQITCNFLKPGDRLVVKSLDFATEVVSAQVTFGQAARTLSMSPLNPGNLGTAPATWQTTVTAGNMASFEWVIRSAAGSLVGNWLVQPVTNGTAVLRPTFTAAGQKLVVSTPDNAVFQESGAVSFGTVVTPTGSDYQFARDFVKNLTVGVNLERGTAVGAGRAYYAKLISDGHITHARHYPPTRLDWNQIVSESGINNFADTVQDMIAAGLKVSLAFLDVTALEDASDQRLKDYVAMCCRVFAGRNIDPRYFAVGAWNELADWTNDNSGSNSIRRYYKDVLRAAFPNHLLLIGSANWSAWEATVNTSLEVFSDKRVLYEWHSYPYAAQDVGTMQNIQAELDDFCTRNGVVTINGELAQAGETGGLDPATIPGVIRASSRGCWQQRNTYWTITGGSYFRMNNSATDFNLEASQAAALREADAYIRAQPGFGT